MYRYITLTRNSYEVDAVHQTPPLLEAVVYHSHAIVHDNVKNQQYVLFISGIIVLNFKMLESCYKNDRNDDTIHISFTIFIHNRPPIRFEKQVNGSHKLF